MTEAGRGPICWIIPHSPACVQKRKGDTSKQSQVVLCFSERREDPGMPQRTAGFKIYKNFLYSPNNARMVKREAGMSNSLTRDLAASADQRDNWPKRDNCGLVPVFLEVSETQKGRDVPWEHKTQFIYLPGLKCPLPSAKSVFQKSVTFQEEVIVFVRCCLCPVLDLVPNRNRADKTR